MIILTLINFLKELQRNTAATAEATNTVNEKVILKRCALFTDCISQINNTQTDNAKIWMLLC